MSLRSSISLDASTDFLVVKHPIENYNNKSILYLEEGQLAVVYYEGKATTFKESGAHRLYSANNPATNLLRVLTYGAKKPCKVFFINTGKSFSNIRWEVIVNDIFIESFECYASFKVSGTFSLNIDEEHLSKLLKELSDNKDHPFISKKDVQKLFEIPLNSQISKIINAGFNNADLKYGATNENLEALSKIVYKSIVDEFKNKGMVLKDVTFGSIELIKDDNFTDFKEIHISRVKQGALGYDFVTGEIVKALNKQAENPGSSALANAGAGAGLGIGMGSIFGNTIRLSTPMSRPLEAATAKQNNTYGSLNYKNDSVFIGDSASIKTALCPNCKKHIEETFYYCPYCRCKIKDDEDF